MSSNSADSPMTETLCPDCLKPLIDCRCSPGECKPGDSIEGAADYPYLSSLVTPWIQTFNGGQFRDAVRQHFASQISYGRVSLDHLKDKGYEPTSTMSGDW